MSAGPWHSPASPSGAAFLSSRIPQNCRQAQAYRACQTLLSSKCTFGGRCPNPCMLALRLPGSLTYPSPAWNSLPRGMADLAACHLAAQAFLGSEVNYGTVATRSQRVWMPYSCRLDVCKLAIQCRFVRWPCIAAVKAHSEVLSIVHSRPCLCTFRARGQVAVPELSLGFHAVRPQLVCVPTA